MKFCECGCGQATKIAKRDDSRHGHIKGQPNRFLLGHRPRKPRPPFVEPALPSGIRAIQLTKEKFALVDANDYEWLNQFVWCAFKGRGQIYYAARTSNRALLFMHRVILGAELDILVDHKDGNGLNNTRDNLRLATTQQNACNSRLRSHNTSGYKGVSWNKQSGKWRADATVDGKHKYIGGFPTPEEAALAYDNFAREAYGEFSRTNFAAVGREAR